MKAAYQYGKFREDGTRKRVHVEAAEKAFGGPLPDGVEVHHVDNDGLHNENTNLVICQDVSYHRLLHVRMRTLAAGGDPNTDKICSTCRIPKNKSCFGNDRKQGDGLQLHCRECFNKHHRVRRARLKAARAPIVQTEGD